MIRTTMFAALALATLMAACGGAADPDSPKAAHETRVDETALLGTCPGPAPTAPQCYKTVCVTQTNSWEIVPKSQGTGCLGGTCDGAGHCIKF